MAPLPIEAVKTEVLAALDAGGVILTAETGSGKSTQVPRWCRARGKVLVVEPRRVACRSLARYVSTLEGETLGRGVGYAHRNQESRSAATEILFVTPGVALRMRAAGDLAGYATVILDEFHERSMELDLLLALLKDDDLALAVMSATLDPAPLTRFLGYPTCHAEGRTYPVALEYVGEPLLPDSRDLARRVRSALSRLLPECEGDVLVFLPGAREIRECLAACRGLADLECLPLHGRLTGAEQDRVFTPGPRRRAVFATNVAETSVTLPRIGAVIDSGLVRRTMYRWGAASLGLVPVARDAAEQRRGRAGRLGPGRCVRLWSEGGVIEEHTPPEIHREPLADLILRAGAGGARLDRLAMLDPPQPYALEHAAEELRHLGALDAAGEVTPRGRRIARQPMPPLLAALLDRARDAPPETRADAIDLAAALSVGPWPIPARVRGDDPDPDAPRRDDATARILAMRAGPGVFEGPAPGAYREARKTADRLRRKAKMPPPPADRPVDREALAALILATNPRLAFVKRVRGKGEPFTNGGGELRPGRDVWLPPDCQAFLCLGVFAREGRRGTELTATCTLPVELGFLAACGLGRRRLDRVDKVKGKIEAIWETVYAGRVIAREEGVPRGPLLAAAVADLSLRGKLFQGLRDALPPRLAARNLQDRLDGAAPGPSDPGAWLEARVLELGVETPDDLELLSVEDLLPAALDPYQARELDRLFPRELPLPAGRYRAEYDVAGRRVVVCPPKGVTTRPSPRDLPTWEGWSVYFRLKNRETKVR